MKIVKTIAALHQWRARVSGKIGFVPTMGYLHEGHISLVKLAQKENEHVVVSIFVNPKQFGPQEDFQKYPRDTERDLSLLKKAKVDVVFLPTLEELYPSDFETYVTLEKIPQKLEGAIRPGHFTGVATVLTKLFNIVQPTHSYFGQKDAQQVIVTKKLVEDLNIQTKIVVGQTLREKDGLAMSSRNVFLNKAERAEAVVLFQALCLAQKMIAKGEIQSKKIHSEMLKLLQTTSGSIDYISIANSKTLEEVTSVKGEVVISLAVRFGKTRLIDNLVIQK